MAGDGLSFDLHVPDGAGDGVPVAVLLHGRGSDQHDLQGLASHLPAGHVVVTPQAPHPGAPWGYGPGWAWYRYLADDRVAADTLAHSLQALAAFLDGLPDRLPFRPGPVLLGGFSQGGTTSLAFALTHPGRVHGVAVFSGFLADAPDALPLPARGPVLDGVPVFWGHGTRDPNIPYALGQRGRSRLEALGADVTPWDGPVGHQITADELAALRVWMDQHGLAASR